jgi:hypothetical protein
VELAVPQSLIGDGGMTEQQCFLQGHNTWLIIAKTDHQN